MNSLFKLLFTILSIVAVIGLFIFGIFATIAATIFIPLFGTLTREEIKRKSESDLGNDPLKNDAIDVTFERVEEEKIKIDKK